MAAELKRKLVYSDLEATPADGKRYELIEGQLLVTPSPSTVHQRVSKRLLLALVDYFERRSIGEVFVAPVDLILTDGDVFVPDLLVVENPAHVAPRGIEGPPLLVVEILSASTRTQDRGIKARRYAELGVEHYWIVDPDGKRVDCHRRSSVGYRLASRAEGDARLMHPDWPELEIDLGALWR